MTALQREEGTSNLILLPSCNSFGGKAEMALERFGQSPMELHPVQVSAATAPVQLAATNTTRTKAT